MIQSESKPTDRPGGREKAPMVIKMRIDGKTAIKVLALKPNSLSMSSFCSMLVEHGMERWEKWEQFENVADQSQAPVMQHEREWGAEDVEGCTTEEELEQERPESQGVEPQGVEPQGVESQGVESQKTEQE
jgi:hypothetical protein